MLDAIDGICTQLLLGSLLCKTDHDTDIHDPVCNLPTVMRMALWKAPYKLAPCTELRHLKRAPQHKVHAGLPTPRLKLDSLGPWLSLCSCEFLCGESPVGGGRGGGGGCRIVFALLHALRIADDHKSHQIAVTSHLSAARWQSP